MDHLTTHVVIGLLADPPELWLATCRVLSRHEPDPGGKLAPATEMLPVVNIGYECCRDNGTNPRYGRQAPARRVLPADRQEACVERFDPAIKIAQLIEQACK
jgi:hypothetical protein